MANVDVFLQLSTSSSNECGKVCHIIQYTGKLVKSGYKTDKLSNHQANFAIWTTYTQEKIVEEYLVYDLTNTTGTLGGSFGLLIGFSFFDFISTIIEHVQHFTERV